MSGKVSYAQNGEDIRVWRAFRDADGPLTYVDVGANEPRHLSITASLSDLGWSGLLIEADPRLAAELRVFRPGDTVVECAASDREGTLTFHAVPGTGLGTLSADEAEAARRRGFATQEITVPARPLSAVLDEHGLATAPIHFMSIDVEGAEASVLAGLDLRRHRPWVLCIEAIEPGSDRPSHDAWEPGLLAADYRCAAFDGVNRWYVAKEHADLEAAIATPFNALDAGEHGWVVEGPFRDRQAGDRAYARRAWQRELLLHDVRASVPASEVEKQVVELRTALALVEASRSWRLSRKAGGAVRRVRHQARVLAGRLPGPLARRLVRARHLRHVRANLPELIDPAYLGNPTPFTSAWIDPTGRPPLPSAGLGIDPLTDADLLAIDAWLAAGPYDDDASLETRTDNHDDEVGRVMAALRTRLGLARRPEAPLAARGNAALVDARCLQTPAFGHRGIGRFAAAALVGVRESLGDDKVVLLIDEGLEPLPPELAGTCRQVTRVTEATVGQYSVLVQPSPMTASPDPLLPLLHSDAYAIAIAYDLIPQHYPSVYLRWAPMAAEYAANLDALRRYDELVCISHVVEQEMRALIGRPELRTSVAWPASIDGRRKVRPGTPDGPIVVMTGDEPRKNTYGALAAIGVATAGEDERDVLVIGMAGQATRVHHWSIHAAMRPGEARTAARMSDEDMGATLASASVVVVPSFDEGLSLPVIEAITSGATVVASDIPAHRELIGRGAFLADPGDPRALARAIRRHARSRRNYPRQQARLAAHKHQVLEQVIGASALAHLGRTTTAIEPSKAFIAGRGLRVGFATPWTPQPTGVADFSATIGRHLAELCDLTVYATSDAQPTDGIAMRPVDELLADPALAQTRHDAVVSVLGNSHFHLPFLELLGRVDAVAVAHDTRMTELYLALRGPGGLEQLMLRGQDVRVIAPPLDEQVRDLRLLQNAGMWEIARRASALVLHAPTAAPIIEAQTGVTPIVLPFASQRVPDTATITPEMRQEARRRLGWDDGRIHLVSFGYVDVRTKLADLVVETAAWLREWGHDVALHFAGKASPPLEAELTERARRAGIGRFEITGFLDEAAFRDHLLAADAGIQLRVSPLLGVSGPLSDLAAWGTPAVASNGLATDVGAPASVRRLPDDASPLMAAEAVERLLGQPDDPATVEEQRQAYLRAKDPRAYAESLLDILARQAGARP